ncbi:MAG: hypothetical protein ABJC98_18790 [Bacteroidota bacterium]
MAIIYKIVCEVKWMHEYYLTSEKGETVFDFAAQADRMNFLFQQFANDAATINSNLLFVMPESQQALFSNSKLKVIPSYSGFKLAVKCNKKLLPDGTTVFVPVVPLPASIPVMIEEKNSIGSFSNNALTKPFHAAWYFSNQDFPFVKAFPFLSNPVPAFDSAAIYEQGAIALHGAGDVRIFLNNGAADPWLKLNGTGYINESDKWLLPLSFSYLFFPADNVTEASFTLKDATAAEVKTIKVSGAHALKSVWLNFHTDKDIVKTIPGTTPAVSSVYSLEVTGNNGYSKTFTSLMFAADAINISNYRGIVNLDTRPANAAFNLIDNDGYLFTRILPDTTRQPAPVFELWMKSRPVFWQYSNNKQRKIKLTPDTLDVLADNSGILMTKNPLSLTYSPVLVKKPDSSFQYLPNPVPGDDVKLSGSKFFVNILVPESKMFPLA